MAEKIVILDGFALNPGDLDWQPLQVLGDVDIHDRTPPELIIQRSQGATCLLVNKVSLTGKIMEALPDLRYIGILATGFNIVDMEAASDVITLHCPLTPENNRLVNSERLNLMKSTALIINTSRGALIDNQALADALNAGVIGGAGLDVQESEPPAIDNPLLTARNCRITPHIAWYAKESRARLMKHAADNLSAFLNGTVENRVN